MWTTNSQKKPLRLCNLFAHMHATGVRSSYMRIICVSRCRQAVYLPPAKMFWCFQLPESGKIKELDNDTAQAQAPHISVNLIATAMARTISRAKFHPVACVSMIFVMDTPSSIRFPRSLETSRIHHTSSSGSSSMHRSPRLRQRNRTEFRRWSTILRTLSKGFE